MCDLNQPKISIQVVTRNNAPFIREALRSAFEQSFQDFEIVLVDDGSTDGSQEIIAEVKDERLRCFFEPYRGLVKARQLALEKARGQWMAVFDGDDISLPNRLSSSLNACEKEELILVGGQTEEMNEEGVALSQAFLFPVEEVSIRKRLGKGYSVCHGTSLFSVPAARAAGGYRDAGDDGFGEDEDLFIRLATKGKIKNLSQILIKRRIHRNSFCTLKKKELFRGLSRLSTESTYWNRVGKSFYRAKRYEKSLQSYWCSLRENKVNPEALCGIAKSLKRILLMGL